MFYIFPFGLLGILQYNLIAKKTFISYKYKFSWNFFYYLILLYRLQLESENALLFLSYNKILYALIMFLLLFIAYQNIKTKQSTEMITRPKKFTGTDDTRNHKNKTLIDLLKIEFKDEINIISPSYSKKNQFGLPQIFIKTNQRLKSFMFYWSKISFLISKIKNTSSDIYFPERNIYSGNSLIRFFINKLWRFKRLKFIDEILPNYDSVLFFPLSFYRKN